MPADVWTILTTAVIPFTAAVAAAWIVRSLVPAEISKRYVLGFALAAGFFAGYWFLPDAALVPSKHWHWLPYLAAVALVGGLTSASDASWTARLLAYGAVAVVAAWKLVPHWGDLQPPWHYAVPLLAGYFLLLSVLLVALPDRLLGPLFVSLLCVSAGATALLITIGFSLKYGQVAAIAAAALVGCLMATLLPKLTRRASEGPSEWLDPSIRGLVPVFAILVGGLAFVGTIDPSPPMPVMLVAPAAPLMLWLFAAGPLARLNGPPAIAAQTAAVLLPLALAIAWVVVSGEKDLWSG
jgi:hypothetical protein